MSDSQQLPGYSSDELDDAAVWLARLRAPDRQPHVERGFRQWLNEKPSHAAAYDRVSVTWELTSGLERRPFPRLSRWERAGFRAGFVKAGAGLFAVAASILVGVLVYQHVHGVATGVGEQRVLTLEDGTRITMNTSSRVRVRYDEQFRQVELKDGEALFDVSKDPQRPFIVLAQGRQIRALGTSFLVRDDDDRLSVTLIEGKVTVSEPQAPAVAPVMLTPGQRLTFKPRSRPTVDAPALEKITGWRRGQVEFDDTPLAEAVAEVNRYSVVKIEVQRPDIAGIYINGVFRIGDVPGFAAAVARSYGFTTETQQERLVLK